MGRRKFMMQPTLIGFMKRPRLEKNYMNPLYVAVVNLLLEVIILLLMAIWI